MSDHGIDVKALLTRLGIDPDAPTPGSYDGTFAHGEGGALASHPPADGSLLATVAQATRADYERVKQTFVESGRDDLLF